MFRALGNLRRKSIDEKEQGAKANSDANNVPKRERGQITLQRAGSQAYHPGSQVWVRRSTAFLTILCWTAYRLGPGVSYTSWRAAAIEQTSYLECITSSDLFSLALHPEQRIAPSGTVIASRCNKIGTPACAAILMTGIIALRPSG